MYENKKEYLLRYSLQNKKIYRLTDMMDKDPACAEKYKKEIKEAEVLKAEIEEKIAITDGGVLTELLYLKYVCEKTLEDIAFILNYSERHTERLHQKALKLFPM